MADPAEYHCPKCAVRPRANLTQYQGRLWRPECLSVKLTLMAEAKAPPRPAHGLVVVDRKRR